MNKLFFIPLILSGYLIPLTAQDFSPLFQQAWEHDRLLQSKAFDLKSAEASLRESRGMYLPTAVFNTQYTLAAGGRSIDFPIGDIMNPVYSTLNALTQSNSFPQIENVSEQFLPNNFYDAKVRVVQPVYYPELALQQQVKAGTVELKALEVRAYQRTLTREVMMACLQREKALSAVRIFASADTLLQEALRTTQSMVRNGIALPSSIARIESQIAALDAQQIEVQGQLANANAYLVFLLGEGGDSLASRISWPEWPDPADISGTDREEILQLEKGIDLQELAITRENWFYRPRVGAQLDLGSQDFNFGWSPYVLLGVNLEINLYDHGRHQRRKEQAQLEVESSRSQLAHALSGFDLQRQIASQNLDAALGQARTFQPRIAAAGQLYRDVLKKYREGSAGYLELIDAQTQVTQSEIQYSLARINAWEKWTDYLYVSAAIDLP